LVGALVEGKLSSEPVFLMSPVPWVGVALVVYVFEMGEFNDLGFVESPQVVGRGGAGGVYPSLLVVLGLDFLGVGVVGSQLDFVIIFFDAHQVHEQVRVVFGGIALGVDDGVDLVFSEHVFIGGRGDSTEYPLFVALLF
jgi:CubicO group peptidase (beta-lactamase class C family)